MQHQRQKACGQPIPRGHRVKPGTKLQRRQPARARAAADAGVPAGRGDLLHLAGVEFQDVVRRRRMVRSYDVSRPLPAEVIDQIVGNGLRAPSAGFSQGWGFLVLDTPADVARFREAVRPPDHPEDWFAANVDAPLLIIRIRTRTPTSIAMPSRTRAFPTGPMPGGPLPTGTSTPGSRRC
jgi:Nitroreductase family